MGINKDLGFVTGEGRNMGPGERWERLFGLLKRDIFEGQLDTAGYKSVGRFVRGMVENEFAGQGSDFTDLDVKGRSTIGSRFATAVGIQCRPDECAFVDGVVGVETGMTGALAETPASIPEFEDGGALGL